MKFENSDLRSGSGGVLHIPVGGQTCEAFQVNRRFPVEWREDCHEDLLPRPFGIGDKDRCRQLSRVLGRDPPLFHADGNRRARTLWIDQPDAHRKLRPIGMVDDAPAVAVRGLAVWGKMKPELITIRADRDDPIFYQEI